MKHITRQGFIKAITLAAGALISLPLIVKSAPPKPEPKWSFPLLYPEIRYSEHQVPRMAGVTCMVARTVIRGEVYQTATYTDEPTEIARDFLKRQAEANFKAIATQP